MDEICRSNIIQRDNKKFARKLSKNLVQLAKEKNNYVSRSFVTLKVSTQIIKQESNWLGPQDWSAISLQDIIASICDQR